MAALFDVFLSDPVSIDVETFDLWIHGHSVDSAARHRLAQYTGSGGLQGSDQRQMLRLAREEAQDHFRVFELLESFLCQPRLLGKQTMCPLNEGMQQVTVQRYHEFDEPVIRELLGRKLTTKFRKDLDDVSASTHVPLRSCQRQFDNLRNAFNLMDERNFQGNIVVHLQRLLLLPQDLAWRYTCLLFILYHRFHVQTSKIKTLFLTTADLELVAGRIMQQRWLAAGSDLCPYTPASGRASEVPRPARFERAATGPSLRGGHAGSQSQRSSNQTISAFDVDPDFIHDLEEIRGMFARSKTATEEYRALVEAYVGRPTWAAAARLAPKFRTLVKRLSSIGARLHQQKEMRDLFEDILDQVLDAAFVEAAVPLAAVGPIFVGLAAQLCKVSDMKALGEMRTTILCQSWTRFLSIVRLVVEKSYAHVT